MKHRIPGRPMTLARMMVAATALAGLALVAAPEAGAFPLYNCGEVPIGNYDALCFGGDGASGVCVLWYTTVYGTYCLTV